MFNDVQSVYHISNKLIIFIFDKDLGPVIFNTTNFPKNLI